MLPQAPGPLKSLRMSVNFNVSRVMSLALLAVTLTLGWPALAEPGAAQAEATDYVVGPQDVLRVTVWGQDVMSGRFAGDSDGTFSYPVIGQRIMAAGLTPRAVEREVETRLLDGYLIDPHVTVAVETYRAKRIFVVGEVRQPGPYALEGEAGQMSLIEALARAGFTTADAGAEVIVVHAAPGASGPVVPSDIPSGDDPSGSVIRVDLSALQRGVLTHNIVLQDGDTVMVPRTESFYILGHVRNPGSYSMRRGITVRQALALAGGISEKGAANRIRITRVDEKGRRESHADLDDPIQPGDTLTVPERFF